MRHERRIQKCRITRRDEADVPRRCFEPVSDPSNRALIRHIIVYDLDRHGRQRVSACANDDDFFEQRLQCVDDVDDQRRAVERKQRLGLPHPGASAAGQHDAAGHARPIVGFRHSHRPTALRARARF